MIFSTFRVNMLGKWIFVFVWPLFLFGAGGWLTPDNYDAYLDAYANANNIERSKIRIVDAAGKDAVLEVDEGAGYVKKGTVTQE